VLIAPSHESSHQRPRRFDFFYWFLCRTPKHNFFIRTNSVYPRATIWMINAGRLFDLRLQAPFRYSQPCLCWFTRVSDWVTFFYFLNCQLHVIGYKGGLVQTEAAHGRVYFGLQRAGKLGIFRSAKSPLCMTTGVVGGKTQVGALNWQRFGKIVNKTTCTLLKRRDISQILQFCDL
jgi:hypothetical protein